MVRERARRLGAPLAAASAALAALCPGPWSGRAEAQASSRQRVGAERRLPFQLVAGLDLDLSSGDESGRNGAYAVGTASLEALVGGAFAVSIAVPAAVRAELRLREARGPAYALGDPVAAAAWTARAGDLRLGLEGSFRYPAGIWEDHEAEARGLRSGTGFPAFAGAASLSRILDPVVASFRAEAETTLPRRERFSWTRRPLGLVLGLAATEALNRSLSISLGLDQGLSLPRRGPAGWASPGVSRWLTGRLALWIVGPSSAFGLSMSKDLSDPSVPAVLGLRLRRSLLRPRARP